MNKFKHLTDEEQRRLGYHDGCNINDCHILFLITTLDAARAQLAAAEAQWREGAKRINWLQAETTEAKGRAVVAETHLRAAEARATELESYRDQYIEVQEIIAAAHYQVDEDGTVIDDDYDASAGAFDLVRQCDASVIRIGELKGDVDDLTQQLDAMSHKYIDAKKALIEVRSNLDAALSREARALTAPAAGEDGEGLARLEDFDGGDCITCAHHKDTEWLPCRTCTSEGLDNHWEPAKPGAGGA